MTSSNISMLKDSKTFELIDIVSQKEFFGVFFPSKEYYTFSGDSLENFPLATVVSSYITYYACGDSHTAKAKRYDLDHFFDFLSQRCNANPNHNGEVKVGDWTLQATKEYIAHRLSLGDSPSTVSRRLATVKHLGRTLAERVSGFVNPAREAKAPILQIAKPKGLSATEIRAIREAAIDRLAAYASLQGSAEGKDCEPMALFIYMRNYALLEVLLSTGLRADEVRQLRMKQLTTDLSWLKNVQTKGKKFRNVYIEKRLRQILEDYLSRRAAILFPLVEKFKLANGIANKQEELEANIPIFISVKSADCSVPATFGLSPKTLWRIIAEFGTRARALSPELATAIHPHLLRHTFAHGHQLKWYTIHKNDNDREHSL